MRFKKAVALILCVSMTITMFGCSAGDVNTVGGQEYHHYDVEEFNEVADKLDAIADSSDSKQILSLYDEMYTECEEIDSLYAVSYVRYASDVSNKEYDKEQRYTYKTLIDCEDKASGICRKITEGDSAARFKKHVGKEAFEYFADYGMMSQKEKKLVNREKSLVDRYYKEYDEICSKGTKYKGETYTEDDLMGEKGENLAYSDYDGYLKVYYKLMKQTNDKVGPIFVKLVKLRTEIAEIEGYDSYADYADKEVYSRDYSRADVEQLHADVKEISKGYFKNIYKANEEGVEYTMPAMSEKDLLNSLQKYGSEIGEMSESACDEFFKKKLYNISDDSGRQEGAFTTKVDTTDNPYIFMTMDNARDFATLTHEFGHFVEFYKEEDTNILSRAQNLDLAEIASNGYEGLMLDYYDEVFKDDANSAIKMAISELLSNITDGCIMDEFQRAVYDNPDMSLKEINKCYANIAAQYDSAQKGEPGYSWVYVGHNFESPMYYISYSVSALAALQIWNQSRKDFDGAVETWEECVKEGTYDKGYMEVIDKCDMIKFTEDGAVSKICKPAIKAVNPNTVLN